MLRYANSYISVRAFVSTTPDGLQATESLKPRDTEISALQRMVYGPGIMETDTIGEARRAGKCQCKRCLQYKDPTEFSKYKKGEAEYSRPYCKPCRVAMERTKRFSAVDTVTSPYPRRLE